MSNPFRMSRLFKGWKKIVLMLETPKKFSCKQICIFPGRAREVDARLAFVNVEMKTIHLKIRRAQPLPYKPSRFFLDLN